MKTVKIALQFGDNCFWLVTHQNCSTQHTAMLLHCRFSVTVLEYIHFISPHWAAKTASNSKKWYVCSAVSLVQFILFSFCSYYFDVSVSFSYSSFIRL